MPKLKPCRRQQQDFVVGPWLPLRSTGSKRDPSPFTTVTPATQAEQRTPLNSATDQHIGGQVNSFHPLDGEWQLRASLRSVPLETDDDPADDCSIQPKEVDVPSPATSSPDRFQGLGYLSLLPGGLVLGQFVEFTTSERIAVSGWERAGTRECFRDPDWSLVKFRIRSVRTGREVDSWAQRTGGDMCSLAAVSQNDIDVLDSLEESERVQFSMTAIFRFVPQTLLSSSKADEFLQECSPLCCGRDAVVVLGMADLSNLCGLQSLTTAVERGTTDDFMFSTA